jgi:hypothetical protein
MIQTGPDEAKVLGVSVLGSKFVKDEDRQSTPGNSQEVIAPLLAGMDVKSSSRGERKMGSYQWRDSSVCDCFCMKWNGDY